MSRLPVIVVGAGIAGLACAWRLGRAGHPALLLERALVPGGRLGGGAQGSPGPGLGALSSADRALLGLAREAGLEAGPAGVPEALFQVRGGRAHEISEATLPGVARIPGVRLHHALRLLRLERVLGRFDAVLDPDAPESGARLDDRSLADFGRLYFGQSVAEHWMGPALFGAALCDERETSRLLFLLRQRTHAGALAYVLSEAPPAFLERLAGGAETRLGAEVAGIEAAPGGLCVRLRRAEGGAEETLPARAVVVATPALEAARLCGPLLEEAERRFLRDALYAPAIWLGATTGPGLARAALRVRLPRSEGSPLAAVSWRAARDGREGELGLLASDVWSAAHLDAPEDVIRKELLGAAEGLLPGLDASLRSAEVARHPRAFPRFPVGRFHALARFRTLQSELRRQGRRLYFAGDHLAGPFAESAARTGLRAAAETIADLTGSGSK